MSHTVAPLVEDVDLPLVEEARALCVAGSPPAVAVAVFECVAALLEACAPSRRHGGVASALASKAGCAPWPAVQRSMAREENLTARLQLGCSGDPASAAAVAALVPAVDARLEAAGATLERAARCSASTALMLRWVRAMSATAAAATSAGPAVTCCGGARAPEPGAVVEEAPPVPEASWPAAAELGTLPTEVAPRAPEPQRAPLPAAPPPAAQERLPEPAPAVASARSAPKEQAQSRRGGPARSRCCRSGLQRYRARLKTPLATWRRWRLQRWSRPLRS
ncbi:unnamed protein product [Prorocentrum cordatum]|uniref:Uncharacterized protein n=1 Tax=Prorocentrum cordatum TaxID=2364126 RepID=A0ABN9QTA2_9DINO|nr:unnamed protein product [Polarella glacialis]